MPQYWSLACLGLVGALWTGSLSAAVALESLAQAPFSNMNQVERLNNPNWQTIPGAEVGRHPAETLMDINGIVRDGNTVTFDVTGYRGFYYRMAGDCETDQVILTRRGRSEGIDEFLYGASQVVGGGQLFYKRRGMVVTIPAELKQYVDYRSFRLSLPS